MTSCCRFDVNTNQPTRLTVDDLQFAVKRSMRRRTLQITVERDGSLRLAAPPEVDESVLRDFVVEKREWIYTKLAEKARLQRQVPVKQFIDGEGFLYLGRGYRLQSVDVQAVALKLVNGRFRLRRDHVERGREAFVDWYTIHATGWLWAKAREFRSRMEVNPAGAKVQDLGYRWGSCGKGDWLYFHWKTVLLPAHIAEYIVVHELAHLHQPHHTPEFWRSIERVLPDFERRKIWLAENGISVDGL